MKESPCYNCKEYWGIPRTSCADMCNRLKEWERELREQEHGKEGQRNHDRT